MSPTSIPATGHPTPDTLYADLSPVRFGRSRNVYGMIATE